MDIELEIVMNIIELDTNNEAENVMEHSIDPYYE